MGHGQSCGWRRKRLPSPISEDQASQEGPEETGPRPSSLRIITPTAGAWWMHPAIVCSSLAVSTLSRRGRSVSPAVRPNDGYTVAIRESFTKDDMMSTLSSCRAVAAQCRMLRSLAGKQCRPNATCADTLAGAASLHRNAARHRDGSSSSDSAVVVGRRGHVRRKIDYLGRCTRGESKQASKLAQASLARSLASATTIAALSKVSKPNPAGPSRSFFTALLSMWINGAAHQ